MSTSQLSIQLYSVRDALANDRDATLAALQGFGFTQVEPFGFTPDSAAELADLKRFGLGISSAHSNFLSKGGDVAEYFAAAAQAGIPVLIEPAIAPERFADRASVEAVAEDLNRAAAVAAANGLQIGYHNHWWELEGDIDGTSPLEFLAARLDPAIALEVDTYWVEVAGRRAVDVLGALGERVGFIHVKDGDASREPLNQLPVGSGVIPVRDILAAAPQAVRVIEFDGYAGDIFEGIQQSVAFIEDTGK